MNLTILGNYGTFPGRDGACSGFLLNSGNTNILIDCGNGVISRLQRYVSIEKLDSIVLSHLHRDHTSDMHVLKYAVAAKLSLGSMAQGIDVYCPLSPKAEYNTLVYKSAFNLIRISDDLELDIKGFKFKFHKMKHPVECYGMRVEKDGKVFAYSADTMANNKLVQLAKDADIFLCESTATERLKTDTLPHLTARYAAETAALANVKKLLLTHLWYEEDRKLYLEEASVVFKNVELSEEFKEYNI